LLVGNKDLPTVGISVEKRIRGSTADTYFQYLGGRVGDLSINVPQEGIVTIDAAWLFKTSNDGTTASVAGTTTQTPDEPVTGFNAEIVVNAVTQTVVQSATLKISNNLDSNAFVVGSRQRKDIPVGQRAVSGTLTCFFEDLALFALFAAETVFATKLSFIFNGNYTEFNMPECKFTGGTPTPQIAGNGTVTATFNFDAFKDSGAYDVRVALKNQVATI
jgi:hypothetical protein